MNLFSQKFWAMACLVFIISVSASAQESPKVEVFGGYSNILGDLHGWNASVASNANRWFGLVTDFSGHYSQLSLGDENERIRVLSYLGGPQFTLRRSRAVPFARLMLGAVRIKSEASGFGQTFVFSDAGFALAIGGGLDVRLNDRLAIRAIQADYMRTRFFNQTQKNIRLTFGVVIRVGGR